MSLPSRADLGLMDAGRQFPHRVAFLCFAGDVFVALACLLTAFWLRFDTVLSEYGVEAPGIVLSNYSNYIIFGTRSPCFWCWPRSRCMTAPGCFTGALRLRK